MSALFKDAYSPSFIAHLYQSLSAVYPSFDSKGFEKAFFAPNWNQMEMKERMQRVTESLHANLPQAYPQALQLLLEWLSHLQEKGHREEAVEYMFLPNFVAVYGLEDLALSTKAMEKITVFTSCEFAIRPFIVRYPDKIWQVLEDWSRHTDFRVRRLASEGCRPRLPWGIGLSQLKLDPSRILPILENLYRDPNDYVYRSVANNLNDIAKDHPSLVLDICSRWKGTSPTVDWLVKHACRTLLKKGDASAIALFSYTPAEKIRHLGFAVRSKKVAFGSHMEFEWEWENPMNEKALVRLEYAMYFRLKNGKHNRKVFKISEKEYAARERVHVKRKQALKPITTRKFYAGEHYVAPILNGKEFDRHAFELLMD